MAIAWDASVESNRTGTSDPHTWTHTPVGVPRAIVVSIVHGTSNTDHVSTVTYGGVSMAEVIRRTDSTTEPGAAELWFLGTGIPTGNQTVSVDLASATTDDIHFVSMSFTGDLDTAVVDSDGINDNATDPSVTLQYNGRTCLSVAALYGGGAAPSSFTENGNCTAVQSQDLGAFYASVIRQTTPGTADFAIGGTASADDVAYVAAAISEIYGVYATPGSYAVTGTDATLTWVGQIHLKASSNIAASAATATTARLTAPSGKTSGADFQAGKISDDTNPLPTIDLGSGKYTELEWCIETVAGLTATDVYEFRVLAEGAVLDTYTVNPTWTIGANSYSLTADSGSYAITGTDTGIARQITIGADPGSYVVTGTDTGLALARKVIADPGSYVVTGTDAGTVHGYPMVADSGSYVVTGPDAALRGPPKALGVLVQAAGAVAGRVFTTQPVIYAVGTNFEVSTNNAGHVITASLHAGTSGTLGGTVTAVLDAFGEAYFTDLSIDTAQSDAQIDFSASGMSGNNTVVDVWPLIAADSGSYVVTGTTTGLLAGWKVIPDSGTYAITGTDATLNFTGPTGFTLVADPGSYAVTGTNAGTYAGWKAIADPGSYAVTGTDTGLLLAARITADSGSYAITGTDATLTYRKAVYLSASANIGAGGTTATTARLTAPSGKTTGDFVAGKISDDTNPLPTVDITTDDYTELEWCIATSTGLTTTDVYEFRVVESDGTVLDTYTANPTWTIGAQAFSMAADSGSYAITGTAAGLTRTALLVPDSGSYAVTGTDANLVYAYAVAADPGSYVLTGTAVALTPQTPPGTYVVTGTAVSLNWNRYISLTPGAYNVVGIDTGIVAQRKITADSGDYAVTGADAALVFEAAGAFVISADSGSYVVTGTDASLISPRSVVIVPGVYLITGTDAGLTAQRYALASNGTYALTGTDATLLFGTQTNRTLVCDVGAYLVWGRPIDMRYGNLLPDPRPSSNRNPRIKPFVAGSH